MKNQPHQEDDAALDSMLRTLGKTSVDGEAFADRVMAKSAQPESAPAPQDSETFFGFAPLSQSVDLAPAKKTSASESVSLPVQTRRARFPAIAWIASAASIAIVVSAFAFSWRMNDESHENAALENGAISMPVETPVVANVEAPKATIEAAEQVESDSLVRAESAIDPMNVEPPSVPIPNPKASHNDGLWRLKLVFDKYGLGTATLNDKKLEAKIALASSSRAFARLNHSITRRIGFLGTSINVPISGEISVKGQGFGMEFPFQSLDEMWSAFSQAESKFRELDSENLPATWDSDNAFVHEIVSKTENSLWELVRKDFDRQSMVFNGVHAISGGKFRNYQTIGLNALDRFVRTGELQLPGSDRTFVSAAIIQERDVEALKALLARSSNSVSLFNNIDEFRQAETAMLSTSPKGQAQSRVNVIQYEIKSLIEQRDKATDQATKTVIINRLRAVLRKATGARQSLNKLAIESRKKAAPATGEFQQKMEALREQARELAAQYNLATDEKVSAALAYRAIEIRDELLALQIEHEKSLEVDEPIAPVEPLVKLLPKRPDLHGLDLVMGDACHLDDTNAKTLHQVSISAGRTLATFDRFASRDFSKHDERRLQVLKTIIHKTAHGPNPEQALATLDQMLQMELPELRLEMVDVLRENRSLKAARLLACYAKYDLAAPVRSAAADALQTFPAEFYRDDLVAGFKYPWPEVAKHSAEALIRLNVTESIPRLVELLDEPDPRAPKQAADGKPFQHELVAINHMKNCTLCHADSQSRFDLGRGAVPKWGEPLPVEYYQAAEGPMVRADVTYLRQDFSVIQKVPDAAPWPENQRFDYVVRRKSLTPAEFETANRDYDPSTNEYREIIGSALRALTNLDPIDNSFETWDELVDQ